jgi:hypothetical protein
LFSRLRSTPSQFSYDDAELLFTFLFHGLHHLNALRRVMEGNISDPFEAGIC